MPPRNSAGLRGLSVVLAACALLALARPPRAVAQPPGASLARYVPAKDLIAYVEFDGLDAHAEAWRKTAAYKILNHTRFGAMLEDLAAQGIDAARKEAGPGAGVPRGVELVSALERIAKSGFVLAVNGEAPEKGRTLLVVRDGARLEVRPLLELLAQSQAAPGAPRRNVEKAGRKILQFGDGDRAPALWYEEGDALVCGAARVDEIIAFLGGNEPSALTSAVRTEVARPEEGFHRVALAFLDRSAIRPPPADAARLGLDSLKRLDFRWGFQDEALLGVVRLVAPSPRQGFLALADQPTFDKDSLPLLPAGLMGFNVASVDPARTYDQVVALNKAADPGAADRVAASEESLRQTLGMDLRKEVLAHLGPQWAVYSPPVANAAGAAAVVPYLDLTVAAQVRDEAAFGKALDRLVRVINARLSAQQPAGRQDPVPQLQKVDGPRPMYVMTFAPGALPPNPLLSLLEPTVVLGKDRLIVAARRQAAESALALGERGGARWTPTGPFVPMMRQLPSRLVLLSVSDPRETLPTLVESLPAIVESLKATMAQAAAQQGPGGRGPGVGELPIQVKPALVPRAAELAELLFPSSFAVTVDPEGVRIVMRDSLPSVNSPAATGVMVALLLPAVQAAREAARRTQCANNLKMIALGLHNYHAAHDTFPKAAIADAQGRPLLSWRVAILPYIEQEALYKRFKLDDPWDSPHNRELLASMPTVYACPSTPRRDPSMTSYRTFLGPGTFLDPKAGVRIADITDGTSFTLAVVEAKESVPWTKPDELPFDPDRPTPLFGAGSSHAGGFNALFVDGSVRFLKTSILTPQLLRALITRSGGEVIDPNSF